ncbi:MULTISPECIES: hypothetical protein [unclassified Bradyrhizobium]|uniref:hypothetical protein n=1 Tax=unclassified Bradyrhizobium TaxID=2631580 RepID=UPI0028E798A8|nr:MULTISPECIES: hypothetical protein [unclassified Bradyrhizobium]
MRLLALTALVLLVGAVPASAKNFATINGKVVTCEQAFAYRDGALFRSFTMLSSDDETEREKRRKAAVADLSNQIADLKTKWNQSSADSRKKLAASITTYALATVIKKAGESTVASGTADRVTKEYAKVAMDRSVEMQKTLVDTAFGNPPSAASVAGLPFGTLAMVIPQLQLGAKIYEIGVFGIESAALIGDWYLNSFDYSQQIDQLEAAIRLIISRSVAVKTAEFMKIKNDIDAACR